MTAWFLLLAALAAATPAGAPDAVQHVLLSAPSPDSLRLDLARLAATTDQPRDAALALYFRGVSLDRATQPDSAIASFRQSLERHATPAARDGLVDVLLRRHRPDDVAAAVTLLEAETGGEGREAEAMGGGDPARLAWAYALAGDPRRAAGIIAPLEPQLSDDPMWRYRIARIRFGADDVRAAANYLSEMAVASRGHDAEAVRLLGTLAQRSPKARLRERVDELITDRNRAEGEYLGRLGGRLVRFAANDGTTVGAYLFADSAARTRAPAVVLLRGQDDALSDYGGLVTALRAGGLAVLIVDPRGTGWSVDARVPSPDTWQGREDALELRVERDLREALGVFGRVARIDTTRFVVAGVGAMAPVAVRAAVADPRVVAVALVDPWVSPVERGPLLVHPARIPGFVQFGFADARDKGFADALFASFDPAASRRVDAGSLGQGVGQFVRPQLRDGFVQWVAESAKRKPRALRPTPRR